LTVLNGDSQSGSYFPMPESQLVSEQPESTVSWLGKV